MQIFQHLKNNFLKKDFVVLLSYALSKSFSSIKSKSSEIQKMCRFKFVESFHAWCWKMVILKYARPFFNIMNERLNINCKYTGAMTIDAMPVPFMLIFKISRTLFFWMYYWCWRSCFISSRLVSDFLIELLAKFT